MKYLQGLQCYLKTSSVLFRVAVSASICKISLTLAYHRTLVGGCVCLQSEGMQAPAAFTRCIVSDFFYFFLYFREGFPRQVQEACRWIPTWVHWCQMFNGVCHIFPKRPQETTLTEYMGHRTYHLVAVPAYVQNTAIHFVAKVRYAVPSWENFIPHLFILVSSGWFVGQDLNLVCLSGL